MVPQSADPKHITNSIVNADCDHRRRLCDGQTAIMPAESTHWTSIATELSLQDHSADKPMSFLLGAVEHSDNNRGSVMQDC